MARPVGRPKNKENLQTVKNLTFLNEVNSVEKLINATGDFISRVGRAEFTEKQILISLKIIKGAHDIFASYENVNTFKEMNKMQDHYKSYAEQSKQTDVINEILKLKSRNY